MQNWQVLQSQSKKLLQLQQLRNGGNVGKGVGRRRENRGRTSEPGRGPQKWGKGQGEMWKRHL